VSPFYRFLEERYGFTDDYHRAGPRSGHAEHLESEQLGLGKRRQGHSAVRGVSFASNGVRHSTASSRATAPPITFYTAGQTRTRMLGPSELSNWSVSTADSSEFVGRPS